MFSAKIITITFLSSFFGIFIVEYLENKPKFKIILKTLLLILKLVTNERTNASIGMRAKYGRNQNPKNKNKHVTIIILNFNCNLDCNTKQIILIIFF